MEISEEKKAIKDNLQIAFEKARTGGQIMELTPPNRVRLYSPDLDIEIAVGKYKSQLKNKETAFHIMSTIVNDLIA